MADPPVAALAGVAFGLSLAAPPGPMNAVIAEESVVRGWLSGFTAGLGAMSADALFCGLTLWGVVGFLAHAPTVRGVMVAAGGLLMLYFAYGAAREASAASFTAADGGREAAGATPGDEPAAAPSARADGGGRGFRKAFALALANPYQILFWLTVGVRMLRPEPLDVLAHAPYVGERLAGTLVVATGSPALLAGFFAGIGLWIVAFPATLVAVGRRVDRFAAGVAWASALVLAGFGVLFLADAGGTLL